MTSLGQGRRRNSPHKRKLNETALGAIECKRLLKLANEDIVEASATPHAKNNDGTIMKGSQYARSTMAVDGFEMVSLDTGVGRGAKMLRYGPVH